MRNGELRFTGQLRTVVYVGYAAHCAGTGPPPTPTAADAVAAARHVKVTSPRAAAWSQEGTQVGWAPWLTSVVGRDARPGETGPEHPRAYNDLAPVKVDAPDVGRR